MIVIVTELHKQLSELDLLFLLETGLERLQRYQLHVGRCVLLIAVLVNVLLEFNDAPMELLDVGVQILVPFCDEHVEYISVFLCRFLMLLSPLDITLHAFVRYLQYRMQLVGKKLLLWLFLGLIIVLLVGTVPLALKNLFELDALESLLLISVFAYYSYFV